MKHTATITKRHFLTKEVIILTLSFDRPLGFTAGQFLTIRFRHNDRLHPRSYSILSPQTQQQELQFCVKLVEGGVGSEAIKQMRIGDVIECLGPLGPFVFDHQATTARHVFIGTGTGVAPLYSMIKTHAAAYPQAQFILLFGARAQEDLYFHEEFLAMERELENFTYMPVLSRETWDGRQGYVQDNLPADLTDTTFYICGQKPMVLATVERLEQAGVAQEHIKSERYS